MEMEKLDAITAQDPFMVEVTREQFTKYIYPDVCNDMQQVKTLFKNIMEVRSNR